MPFAKRKLKGQNKFKVFNKDTGRVAAKSTTKEKAERQVRFLNQLKEGEGGSSALIKKAKMAI